jgi:hypothetical protein
VQFFSFARVLSPSVPSIPFLGSSPLSAFVFSFRN